MRIALLHTLFEELGGGEVLALQMYRALRQEGHDVDLYSVKALPDVWRRLKSMFPEAKVNVLPGYGFPEALSRGRLVR
ncbi:MAG: hypothetical protein ACP5HK_05885, partial [Acidilobus sp.]